jgi:glycine/D-amino acid oxidase-like deaminating enzyme
MRKNVSPWLHQLDTERAHEELRRDIATDVAIIGAGIAGIATAFEILEKTTKSVVVLERWKIAHGATGHNAGQVVAHFERGLKSLADEFGLDLAAQGQKDVENAWNILDHIYAKAKLDIPYFKFMGRTGFTSAEQVMLRLENNRLRKEAGLHIERIFISEDAGFVSRIPRRYVGLYSLVKREKIIDLLETTRSDFLAVLSYQKGVINSALLCEKVVAYLTREYKDRFAIYEHTPISKVALHTDHAILDAGTHAVRAGRVVLCTNGFENLRIFNESGLDIDTKYHYLVTGKTGYMSGYLEKNNKPPVAISYFTDPGIQEDNSYFYLTRRPYEFEAGVRHNLISIGGPDVSIEDTTPYSREDDYPEEHAKDIDDFIKSTYDTDPNKKIDYVFTWHGLMGYTKNGVRLVGPEPKNPVLLYNLGCNGIGILPSLYGSSKIARHIKGEKVERTIFDVPASPRSRAPHQPSGIASFLARLGF